MIENVAVVRFDFREAATISIFIIAALLGPYVTIPLFALLAILAMKKNEWTVKALSLMVLLVFFNPGLSRISSESALTMRWLVIFAAVLSTAKLINKNFLTYQWTVWLLLFIAYCGITSYFVNNLFIISAMKLLSFGLSITACSFIYKLNETYNYGTWFFTLLCIILFVSFIIYPFPVARFRNGQGFQGILGHPNAFGIYLAPFLGWLVGIVMEKKTIGRNLMIAVIITIVIAIYKSLSRTALLTFVFSAAVSFGIIFTRNDRKTRTLKKTFGILILILSINLPVLMVLKPNNRLFTTAQKFLLKDSSKENETELSLSNIIKSREDRIESSTENFKKNKFFGNGFGVASKDEENSTVTLSSIPTSAPTEKCFLITAILEECGLFGLLLFLIFIYWYAQPVLRFGRFSDNMLFWSSFIINFGEMVFFAAGGLGMQVYILMSFARWSSLKNKRNVR